MKILVIKSRITPAAKDRRQELIDEIKEQVKNNNFIVLPLGYEYSVVEVDDFKFDKEAPND